MHRDAAGAQGVARDSTTDTYVALHQILLSICTQEHSHRRPGARAKKGDREELLSSHAMTSNAPRSAAHMASLGQASSAVAIHSLGPVRLDSRGLDKTCTLGPRFQRGTRCFRLC